LDQKTFLINFDPVLNIIGIQSDGKSSFIKYTSEIKFPRNNEIGIKNFIIKSIFKRLASDNETYHIKYEKENDDK